VIAFSAAVLGDDEESDMTDAQGQAHWNVAEWHGKMLVDRTGAKIGKLQDVYVDVETDEPQFATVKEGFIGRHLTFVPLSGIEVGPDELKVAVTKDQVRSAPDIEMHGDRIPVIACLPSMIRNSGAPAYCGSSDRMKARPCVEGDGLPAWCHAT